MIGLKTCNNLGVIYYLSFSVITFAGSRLEDKLIELFTTQSFTRSFKSSTPPQYSRFQQITLRHRSEERDDILGSSIRCKRNKKKISPTIPTARTSVIFSTYLLQMSSLYWIVR